MCDMSQPVFTLGCTACRGFQLLHAAYLQMSWVRVDGTVLKHGVVNHVAKHCYVNMVKQ